ncbi:phosphoenolpyruvate carboxykinase (ATP) [Arachidicoccus soli]|uniref:Phosphoenolpyruvate carboxykinase (ATP) n=1 Tax=Arachidicoccus soli TaxID=2341117 RepID=A0A386HMA2_9BACT|nr:phosphoenolpyruvate carboxykinase (ATP) [Arachidicoccus soli]AYD46873.1 phosphoenolpyruvate carboxykinase (ATP) [Arachidicoccus soli]
MLHSGTSFIKDSSDILSKLKAKKVYTDLSPQELVEQTLQLKQGKLSSSGALCVDTGKFTGRSPKDKFIVKDNITEHTVNWGEINLPISPEIFDNLYTKIIDYFSEKDIWIRYVQACASEEYAVNIRVINETPWANLFCNNLFIRQENNGISQAKYDWQIIQAPGFLANPQTDGTRQENFTIVNFTKKIILIGGSAYTGEIKKGMFSVLNFLLPENENVLSMHCSANEGKKGDVALFFGLSGTGKTTLSADSERALIGDDEHGWAHGSIFNFEGGCYAKCINLTAEKEPQIFKAIRPGTLLENVRFIANSNLVDFEDASVTENTRAAYPIHFMDNAKKISNGAGPKNIFFLTCDAFGILPPISRLTKEQAMYHFISGYTAKVAGTEVGITEPQTVFSACFGNVFLPLHPIKYAELLGKNLEKNTDVKVWLINTGWSGGAYGIGKRINLTYTRAMIAAAINGDLENVEYIAHDVFGVLKPQSCPNVPSEILNPRKAWNNNEAYDLQATKLAKLFIENFKKYADKASTDILSAAPKI